MGYGAFTNLFAVLVAKCLHNHGTIRRQLGTIDPERRERVAHPNPFARPYAEDATRVHSEKSFVLLLPRVPRCQIDLEAARPQFRHNKEERHVEVPAEKGGGRNSAKYRASKSQKRL